MTRALRITPVDSASVDDIARNIEENLSLIEQWVPYDGSWKSDKDKAFILSAGPSLVYALETGYIKPELHLTHKIFTVKHALPSLLEFRFTALNCVVLDPRPVDGVSTHGVLRSSLYDKAPTATNFLVASMTHPSVTRYLLEKGRNVIGWHAATNALSRFTDKVKDCIAGGTCSALRAIPLANLVYGIKEFNLLGFDSTVRKGEVDLSARDPITGEVKFRKMWVDPIGHEGTWLSNKALGMWTTGELAAQLQDIQNFLMVEEHAHGYKVNVVGTDKSRSLVGQLWESYVDSVSMLKAHGALGHPSTIEGIRLYSEDD